MNHGAKTMDLLLVEDDPSDVRVFKDLISQCSGCWRLIVVSDGVEAMLYLRQQEKYAGAPRPSLVLLDLNLPKKDGREVLSEIKGDAQLTSIPVIILTTSRSEQDIRASYLLHASAFITKPRERKEFIDIIKGIDNYWTKVATPPPTA